jgi:hypothetical protein
MDQHMSLESVLARISMLNAAMASPMPAAGPLATATAAATPAAASASSSTPFAQALQSAQAPAGSGAGIVATAKSEVGQVESPPGSNDSARISEYRSAVPGGPVGPWCAYFVSWVAAQNGTPLGEDGKGFARVDDVYAWAQRSGRVVPAGPNVQPKPGDLIIWDEHMGIVESVAPDGRITTIEGNSSDSVAQRTYGPDGGGAIGYVRMS